MQQLKTVWYKHYPSDWRADKKLRMVSRAARSFWLDCLGLMYEDGTHRLELNGRAMTVKEIAKALGDNPRTAKKLLGELIEFNVCSVESGDYIISRRILRDFKKAEKDASNGRMGGNPSLKTRENGDIGVNPEVKAQNQKPEPEKEDTNVSLSDQTPAIDEIAIGIHHFNAIAQQVGWPQVQKVSPPRRSALKQRIKDVGGLDAWMAAIDRASLSPLLTGDNNRGWAADFDWLAKPANFTKLMEGNYDPRNASHNGNGNRFNSRAAQRDQALADEILAAARAR